MLRCHENDVYKKLSHPISLFSPSAETINDGQFHTVELVTFERMVNLSIDGGDPMTMDSFGKAHTLNSEAPLYVGGRTAISVGEQGSNILLKPERASVLSNTSTLLQGGYHMD